MGTAPDGGIDAGADASATISPSSNVKSRPAPVVLRYTPAFDRERIRLTSVQVLIGGRDLSGYDALLPAGRHDVSVILAFKEDGDGKDHRQTLAVEVQKPQQVMIEAKVTELAAVGSLQERLQVSLSVGALDGLYIDQSPNKRLENWTEFVIVQTPPTLPPSLIRAGTMLTGVWDICVADDGRPQSLTLLVASSEPELDAAFADASSRWRFDAAKAVPEGGGFCYVQRNVLKVDNGR